MHHTSHATDNCNCVYIIIIYDTLVSIIAADGVLLLYFINTNHHLLEAVLCHLCVGHVLCSTIAVQFYGFDSNCSCIGLLLFCSYFIHI